MGFTGVGNMGSLMPRNLIRAGHSLKVYDLSEEAVNFVVLSRVPRRRHRSRMQQLGRYQDILRADPARRVTPRF